MKKIIFALVTLLFYLPIWYYLLYAILSAIHPDRLVWFLFYMYMPFGVLVNLLQKLIEAEAKR